VFGATGAQGGGLVRSILQDRDGPLAVRAVTRSQGREVRHADVTPEVYRGFGFPGADDLGDMFQFNRDFNADCCAARSIEHARSFNPRLQSFAPWLDANAARIPLS
jgi:hypothetical protein